MLSKKEWMLHLNKLKESFHILRSISEGFNRSIEIAEEMDVEPIFSKTCKGKRKKHFDHKMIKMKKKHYQL
jgi:hypothetical protein